MGLTGNTGSKQTNKSDFLSTLNVSSNHQVVFFFFSGKGLLFSDISYLLFNRWICDITAFLIRKSSGLRS